MSFCLGGARIWGYHMEPGWDCGRQVLPSPTHLKHPCETIPYEMSIFPKRNIPVPCRTLKQTGHGSITNTATM